MRKKFLTMQYSIALLFGVLLLSTPLKAQLEEVQKFLEAGEENVSALTAAYLKPLPTGLSTSLNSGWTSKAAPTKTLGFSLQIRAAVATVPSGAQTFDARELDLQGITVVGESSNTISGGKENGQTLIVAQNTPGEFAFDIPGGTGFEYVPVPIVQGNVGLIKKTDITVRFVPETELGDFGQVSLIGGAIKHDIGQWLPGSKLLPVDISLMAAFTKVDMDANLEFNPGATDQKLETSTNTFVLNALVGKTLPFLSAYAGVGYQTGTFTLDMLGDYQIGSGPATTTITDPVSYEEESDASVHALAGVQFKLAIFRIYLEATAANYFTVNGGIGIGFRN